MRRYDFHVVGNLLERFFFAALVLFSLAWVNSIFLSLKTLVVGIQDWGQFAKYTTLMLPEAILPMLPFSAFLSAAFVSSRMHARREFAIFEFSGIKPVRLVLPFAHFGLCIALAAAAIEHHLLPVCNSLMRELDNRIASEFSLLRLKEGQFQFLDNGLVVHIRSVTESGEIKNMFVHQRDATDHTKAYFAEDTRVVQGGDAPFIQMENGRYFDFAKKTKTLSSTKFSEFKIGIGVLLDDIKKSAPSVKHVTTSSLLGNGGMQLREAGVSLVSIRVEIHSRNAVTLLCAILPLLGMAAMYACRRAGLTLRTCWGVTLSLFTLVYLFNVFAVSIAEENAEKSLYAYAPLAFSLTMAAMLLWTTQRIKSFGFIRRLAAGQI